MFLDALPAQRQPVTAAAWKLPKLKPMEWCLFDRHIYFRCQEGEIPHTYHLSQAGHSVGITLYDVRHVVVSDLIVQGFQLDGVNAHGRVFDGKLLGLTCRGNGRSGVSVGGACRVEIEACLVGNNGAAQVRTEGYSITRISKCDLVANTAPAIVREGGRVFVDGNQWTEEATVNR